MKTRTVTLRIECQTDKSLDELRDITSIELESGERLLRRDLTDEDDGEIVQVSCDVAQPAKKGGARVPKRKAAK